MQHSTTVRRARTPEALIGPGFLRKERGYGLSPAAFCLLSAHLLCHPMGASAQVSAVMAAQGKRALPEAPGFLLGAQGQRPAEAPAMGSLSGTVTDVRGDVVPGATVTLVFLDGQLKRTATSDDSGSFSVPDLRPGSYILTVEAPGLAPYRADNVPVSAGESRALPTITLALATAHTEMDVSASPDQIAAAQVQMAEKQRVLGIVPNFYTSYIWDAAPLTPKLKFSLSLHSSLDPVAFLIAGGVAGVEQARDVFPHYGSGPGAYGKRYGAAYADNVIGRALGSALLPSLFHQDPRYFYKGKGSFGSRAGYAVESTFVTRGDNGRAQPNYSHILGNFLAAGISNLYRAPEDRSVGLTLRNGGIITGSNIVGNLVREFVLKGYTTKVPSFARGQP